MRLGKFLSFCFLSIRSLYAHPEIVVQEDYWSGTKCLENGIPWHVPAAIYEEDRQCTREDVVLDMGTGGSTVFFAQRCKHVIAIETDPEWAKRVQEKLDSLGLTNV